MHVTQLVDALALAPHVRLGRQTPGESTWWLCERLARLVIASATRRLRLVLWDGRLHVRFDNNFHRRTQLESHLLAIFIGQRVVDA
jgi:hypothetical protein